MRGEKRRGAATMEGNHSSFCPADRGYPEQSVIVHHLQLCWTADFFLFDLTSGYLLSLHFWSFLCCVIAMKLPTFPFWKYAFGLICRNAGGGYHQTHTNYHFFIHIWAAGGSRTYGAQAEHTVQHTPWHSLCIALST